MPSIILQYLCLNRARFFLIFGFFTGLSSTNRKKVWQMTSRVGHLPHSEALFTVQQEATLTMFRTIWGTKNQVRFSSAEKPGKALSQAQSKRIKKVKGPLWIFTPPHAQHKRLPTYLAVFTKKIDCLLAKRSGGEKSHYLNLNPQDMCIATFDLRFQEMWV